MQKIVRSNFTRWYVRDGIVEPDETTEPLRSRTFSCYVPLIINENEYSRKCIVETFIKLLRT